MPQSKNIKVLYVTGWYPTRETPNAGTFVNEHARAVKKMGVDVKVAHIWPVKDNSSLYKPVFFRHEEQGIDSYSVLIYSRYPGLWYNLWPVLQNKLFKVVNEEITGNWMPDLIHGHALYPAGFLTLKLSEQLNIPFLLTEHWSKLSWVFNRPFYARLGRRVYREAESIHPVSMYLSERIRDLVPDSAEMKVIPNVVNAELFKMIEPSENDSLSRVRKLLCVTRFSDAIKQPELLVDAFSLLDNHSREKLELTFIGPGEGQQQLKEKVEKLGFGKHFSFLGGRPKSFVASQMRNSDYLLHPSRFETFGVVVAEALCCGVPCIVSDVPALHELVNKDNGYLVSENTVNEWSKVLKKIAFGELQFERREIANNNRKRFSYEQIGEAYLQAYRNIIG